MFEEFYEMYESEEQEVPRLQLLRPARGPYLRLRRPRPAAPPIRPHHRPGGQCADAGGRLHGLHHIRLTYEADLPARSGLGTSIEENGIFLVFGITRNDQIKFLHFSSVPQAEDMSVQECRQEDECRMMDEGFPLVHTFCKCPRY